MIDEEEFTSRLNEVAAVCQEIWATLQAQLAVFGRQCVRLWQRIAAWIQRQGPCPGIYSPALAYATPAMRRHAAKRRARLVTRRLR